MPKEKDKAFDLSDDQLEQIAKLEDAREVARRFFDTQTPTPEMIFGIFDRVIDDAFDDDEDDED